MNTSSYHHGDEVIDNTYTDRDVGMISILYLDKIKVICYNVTGVLLEEPMRRISETVGMNEVSALGFIGTLATNVTTFGMMRDMDDKGVVLNSAFAVSAAFTFAGHLAFTMSFNSAYVLPVIVGKLVAGVCAVAIAWFMFAKTSRRP